MNLKSIMSLIVIPSEARNLLFLGGSKKRIPRFARNDNGRAMAGYGRAVAD